MYNKITIIGRLGGDPEQSSPNAPVKFRVATTEKYKDRDGNKQERTDWHQVEAWGKLGEICQQYLHKGKLVFVTGAVQYSEHNEKWYTSIRADEMKMLDSKGDS